MKTLKYLSFPVKGIGITAVLLLLTQSAFALGTDEDTDINNRAIVDYDVGGIGQTIESAPGVGNNVPGAGNGTDTVFEVDRLIDFELVGPAGNTIIVPNQLDAVLTFTMTNSGNDHQDFVFTVGNLGGDNFDMDELTSTLDIFVDTAPLDGVYTAGVDTDLFVDELPPDGVTTATIFVVADATNPIPLNGELADLQLEARAHDGNDGATGGQGGLAADDSGATDIVLTVQNVFAEGVAPFDNRFQATGTYEVVSAQLNVTKVSAVISDPFSTGPNWKAIPGAIIEYTVTIENTSATTAASNVSVSDTIQIANVTFNDGDPYGTLDAEITVNTVVDPDLCEADGNPADGCTYDPGTGALVIGTTGGLSIPALGTAIVTYQVTIL